MKFFNFIIILLAISCGNNGSMEKAETDRETAGSSNKDQAVRINTNKDTAIPLSDIYEADKDTIPYVQYKADVIRAFPHDKNAYTQGLLIHNGYLYESTGQYGSSSVRKLDLKTGDILLNKQISYTYFGEGITIFDNKLYFLTWRSRTCLVMNPDDFGMINQYSYTGEGWGLTDNGKYLFMSDGSNFIRVLDPMTFKVIKTLAAYESASPLYNLNELEMANGMIYANIWMEDHIVMLDPDTGALIGKCDLSFLREKIGNSDKAETLNGIAYNPESGTFIVTGKYWDSYFEIEISPSK